MALTVGFVELLAGALLLIKAISNATWKEILQGQAGAMYRSHQSAAQAAAAASSSSSTASASPASVGSSLSSLSNVVGGAISGKGLPALPYGTALKGAAATAWAAAILTALGAPITAANVSSLEDWFDHEGGGGANNPLNTTLSDTPGVTGSINSVGVKSYSSPADGVEATVKTLEGGYSAIVAALKSGAGLSNAGPAVSSELSTWSGGGYSSL